MEMIQLTSKLLLSRHVSLLGILRIRTCLIASRYFEIRFEVFFRLII